jgi:hypothetical protein
MIYIFVQRNPFLDYSPIFNLACVYFFFFDNALIILATSIWKLIRLTLIFQRSGGRSDKNIHG